MSDFIKSLGSFDSLLGSMIRLAAPTIMVALGGIFAFRIKLFPIMLEGLMLAGCFAWAAGTYATGNPNVGIIVAALAVMVINLIYAVAVFEAGANGVVSGFALITVITGLTRYLLPTLFKANGKLVLSKEVALPKLHLDFLTGNKFLNSILNDKTFLVYLAFILAVLVWFILYKTTYGLHLRATGENEEASKYINLKTRPIKYAAMAICGLFCGLGGAQLASASNLFTIGMTDGRGYIAIAAIVLSKAEPFAALLVCLLYGLSSAIVVVLSSEGYVVQFLSMLPYAVTILIAIIPPAVNYLRQMLYAKRMSRQVSSGSVHADDF